MNLPMSGGEIFVAIVSTVAALFVWARWYFATAPLWPASARAAPDAPVRYAPVLAAALIAVVLRTVASYDVVNDIRYLYMYFALGMAWVGTATYAFPIAGLIMRDDVIERRNAAVAAAIGGAILGIAAAYAGGNIGDGPGWWVVVGCAIIATAGLFAAWIALEMVTGISEQITVERDASAGWRLGGFLFACGLVLGRAVAGDWFSLNATLSDALRRSWPVLVFLAGAIACERTLRGSVTSPQPRATAAGWMPAFVMVASAVLWIAWLGAPQ